MANVPDRAYDPARKAYFHGTRTAIPTGGEVLPTGSTGAARHYDESSPKHVYATTSIDRAIMWGRQAHGEGRLRVYRVEPTGQLEQDPNNGEDADVMSTSGLKVNGEVLVKSALPEKWTHGLPEDAYHDTPDSRLLIKGPAMRSPRQLELEY